MLEHLVKSPTECGGSKAVAVLLHGLGSHSADIIGFAYTWAEALPNVEFLVPNAPESNDLASVGRQWFSMQDRSLPALRAAVAAGAKVLDDYLDEVLAERGIDDSRMALIGFSQGAMVALHVGLRRRTALAGILGYSGMLLAGPELFREVLSRPPVLLIHGEADGVVPKAALDATVISLRAVGVNVDAEIRPSLGHTVDEFGFQRGLEFLTNILGHQ